MLVLMVFTLVVKTRIQLVEKTFFLLILEMLNATVILNTDTTTAAHKTTTDIFLHLLIVQ